MTSTDPKITLIVPADPEIDPETDPETDPGGPSDHMIYLAFGTVTILPFFLMIKRAMTTDAENSSKIDSFEEHLG